MSVAVMLMAASVTAVAAEAGSVRVTTVAVKAVEDSAEVTVLGTVASLAEMTEVLAEVK
jgi:hypothetical protein